MAKIKGTIIVDIERCKGCGVCVPSCPNNVLALSPHVNGKGYNYSYMANRMTASAAQAALSCARTASLQFTDKNSSKR